MILTINTDDWEYLKEKSTYNHNYYRLKRGDKEIYERCHENYDFYEYSLIEDGDVLFLGCSRDCMEDKVIEIDFRVFYT